MTLRMRRILFGGIATLALAVAGACAGDADVDATLDDTTETTSDESATEYCEFAAELDAAGETPSQADLDRIVELAPDEIKADVETLAEGVAEENFDDPDVQAAGERLEAWEDDNCPEDESDTGGGTSTSTSTTA